ncbi:hypothetical protein [Pseudomonas tolaasii]|uniref:hypothetical protein n=1 Tax=Pseudomonas tolaasii TaxID=29442 RepID=UPI0027365141|nr:hypothetical protein [Pseudomonas tolaasii]WLH54629.1 hypothetical protein PSH62_13710 [Pseudomonas tolaasii]
MTQTLNPFPIFPTMSVFVRCINEGLDFPANIHVLHRLSQVDQSSRPVEMCRHAADFILESMQTRQTPWAGRYLDYTAVLQTALNWSFLIDRQPISDWDQDTFTRFLHFINLPDANWIASHAAGDRFQSQGQPVLIEQPINPKWRPCVRADREAPIVSTVMRQVHRVTYRFLVYLARTGIRNQPAPVISNMPETPPDKGLQTANLSPQEMDWLFAHLEKRRRSNLHHEVCRFLMAAARYTDIPMVDLADDGRGAGLLSQFMTYARPPRPGDPPRCSPWVFIDNPGAPLETEHPLSLKFVLILKDYVQSRGLDISGVLPDIRTLPETGAYRSMSTSTARYVIRTQRSVIANAARDDEQLLDAAETAAKLDQLTFSLVRRSARANLAVGKR